MVELNLYDYIKDNNKLLFVDIVARYNGRWVLCKKKNRETWECPGGHIEKGETPEQAAKRELWEETGAVDFHIESVGYYGIKGSDGILESDEEVFGQIYYSDIKAIGELPCFEMDKAEFFDELPNNMTYPYAHPIFIDLVEKFILNREISIKQVEMKNTNMHLMEQLARVLAYSEPENFKDCLGWWEDWFSERIPGDKLTIIAEKGNFAIGVVRFWRSPYCDNKWLIEGLEVIPSERRKGIGKSMVAEGIKILQNITREKLFVHIHGENSPSIKLHEGLGFRKISRGSINSYGDFRENIGEYVLKNQD